MLRGVLGGVPGGAQEVMDVLRGVGEVVGVQRVLGVVQEVILGVLGGV